MFDSGGMLIWTGTPFGVIAYQFSWEPWTMKVTTVDVWETSFPPMNQSGLLAPQPFGAVQHKQQSLSCGNIRYLVPPLTTKCSQGVWLNSWTLPQYLSQNPSAL